ncbi:IucA/IucC family siderophore biosynthesis protein, partial [Streptomyces sp. NPDC056323]
MPKYPASHDSAESAELLSTPELNRTVWDGAAARLLAKMLGQFAYEEVIEPAAQAGGDDTYTLALDDGKTLVFRARRGVYGSWRVVPD